MLLKYLSLFRKLHFSQNCIFLQNCLPWFIINRRIADKYCSVKTIIEEVYNGNIFFNISKTLRYLKIYFAKMLWKFTVLFNFYVSKNYMCISMIMCYRKLTLFRNVRKIKCYECIFGFKCASY